MVRIDYIIQLKAGGIAKAFLLAEPHITGQAVALVLGDILRMDIVFLTY